MESTIIKTQEIEESFAIDLPRSWQVNIPLYANWSLTLPNCLA